jgi:two-component sensor histidine kinase
MIATKHPREAERLRSLNSFGILDTEAERDFDDIVKLAATLCGTDASTITFVDETRQWFKAAVGMPEQVAPIELALCAHTVLENELVEIPDTRDDPRTADNPLCASEGGCRFYAGAQLTTQDGLQLGTLCVLGFSPHRLNDVQRNALRVLANQIMRMLELRRALKLAEILRHEVDHRVKNSLQAVASFTSMQSRKAKSADAKDVLDVVQRQIQSTAQLHDLLYKTDTEGVVDLRVLLESVAGFIAQVKPHAVQLGCAVDSVQISSEKAAKVALIINELATNSIKHGFPDNRAGVISITGREIVGGRYEIVCMDDGIGNSGVDPDSNGKGLGLKIIKAAASNIQASILWSKSGAGFGLTLIFPIDG